MPSLIVLTGAMGAGKSTVLEVLAGQGLPCVLEPARRVLSAQRAVGGTGVPETDPRLFCELMLAIAIEDYRLPRTGPAVFDRGIPDLIAYARLFGLDDAVFRNAARLYRYHNHVFFFAGWPEIYATDDERKMSAELAGEFGVMVRRVYEELGCEVVEVPRMAVRERAEFVNSHRNN